MSTQARTRGITLNSPSRVAETLLFADAVLVMVALYLADTVGPIPLALCLGALPIAWRWPAQPAHSGTWSAVTVLFLIYAVTSGYLDGTAAGAAEGALHFVLYLLVNKLFHRSTTRDRVQLLLLTMMGLLAVAGVTEELLFASVFLLYVVLGVTSLLFIHLADAPAPAWRREGPLRAGLVWVAVGSSLVVLLLAGLIFLLMPRIGLGLFFTGRSIGPTLAGFQDKVSLGDLRGVRGGSRVIARVEFPDRDGPPDADRRYFRGGGYSSYDGQTWRIVTRNNRRLREDPAQHNVFRVREDQHRQARFGRFRRPSTAADLLRQQIYLEPLGINVMPVADRALSVTFERPRFAAPRSFHMIFQDIEGAIRIWRAQRGSLQYEVLSDVNPPAEAQLRGQGRDYPAAVRAANLDLSTVSPRVCALAREMAGAATDPYDQAAVLERALRTGYRYAEDDEPSDDLPPLEHFLFERRAGHCEYFSSALALLLRCLDVPTRNVTGFAVGEWNEFGGYLSLRESDAHSWTEVYFPESSWQRFDPTPASGRSAVSLLGRLYDAARLLWFKYVVEYDLERQVRALGTFSRMPSTPTADPEETRRGRLPAHVWAIIVSAAALVVIWLVARRSRGVARRAGHTHPATELYRLLERGLARRGLRRDPAETPRHFAQRAVQARPDLGPLVREITDLHEGTRYGDGCSPAAGWDALRRRLRRQLRQNHRLTPS